MPKGHKSGNLKQRNKPFKGKSKAKTEEKNAGIGGIRKKIKKQEAAPVLTKQERKNRILQKRKDKELKSKEVHRIQISGAIDPMLQETLVQLQKLQPNPPKIVLLAPFNSAADPSIIKQNLTDLLKGEDIMNGSEPETTIQESKVGHDFHHKEQGHRKTYKSPGCLRQFYLQFLDYCKVADVVCIVLSCKDVETKSLTLNPHLYAKAFDELGYEMLEYLRAQGVPTIVNVIQDIDVHHESKRGLIKDIYQRFYQSELGDEKILSLEKDAKSYLAFLRMLQTVTIKEVAWRDIRSYMMASKIEVDAKLGVLEVTGFLRGTCLNPNQLIHVTGFGDFQVGKIDILSNPCVKDRNKAAIDALSQGGAGSGILASKEAQINEVESLDQLINNKNLQKIVEKESEKASLEENKHEAMEEEKAFKVPEAKKKKNRDEMTLEEKLWDEMENLNIEDQAEDVSYDEALDQTMMNAQEEKNKLKFTLAARTDDEFEFVDEIDYPVNVNLRERFRKYIGLKSFRHTDWNQYTGIPSEFERIAIFDDFNKTQRNAVAKANASAFAVAGFYVKLYVINFPLAQLQNHDKEKPFIVSSLLQHERKITLVNMEVRRTQDPNIEVKSKDQIETHIGFRVFNCRPLFSRTFTNCPKVKMEKKAHPDKVYLATAYAEVTYRPANVLMFKVGASGKKELVATGELKKADPLKVILKRVILTGYPLKIHKRKAVVRMMFFNQPDVKYFAPTELVTKHRLRGHIKESLGTHGLMKCIFSNNLKPNDTICMHLYKRVFPTWPFEKIDSSFNTLSKEINMLG